MAYSGYVVRSKFSVIIGSPSGRDSGLNWGVGELLVWEGQARVNEGRQLMFMVYKEHLHVCTEITCKYCPYIRVM